MARSNPLDTRTINYLELIGSGKQYRVPSCQRDYSWKEEQWEGLWTDILQLLSDRNERHFLGTLVVEADDDREFLIIDGQQRLATLSLLALAVIAHLDSMVKNGIDPGRNGERSRELRNRFVGEKDPASLLEHSRLHLNDTDNAFYQDRLIQLKEPLNARKLPASNRSLWNCHRYFLQRLSDCNRFKDDGLAVASLLSETVARQLFFILITVDDELSAYAVFETLNARGVELTTTDLLKNYLFSNVRIPAEMESLKRRWRSLVETVGQGWFPDFLRCHLLCQQPGVRSQRLFKLVRDQIRSADDVFALLDTLEPRAELYAAVQDPNHGYWADLPDARKHVGELSLFRARQPMPLLFAAWEEFSERDFVRVLRLVSTVSFRFGIVSGLNTNRLEPAYHQAAKAVIDHTATNLAGVFERIRQIYVDDAKMRQDFARLMISTRAQRKRLVKYVLARLEEAMSGRPCDPDTDPGTIEHVLPENPSRSWEETYPSHRWEQGVQRLGNLTLIEAGLNRRAGNEEYSSKLEAYRQSRYALTTRIPELAPEQWTEALLTKRQQELARLAVQVWRADFN